MPTPQGAVVWSIGRFTAVLGSTAHAYDADPLLPLVLLFFVHLFCQAVADLYHIAQHRSLSFSRLQFPLRAFVFFPDPLGTF